MEVTRTELALINAFASATAPTGETTGDKFAFFLVSGKEDGILSTCLHDFWCTVQKDRGVLKAPRHIHKEDDDPSKGFMSHMFVGARGRGSGRKWRQRLPRPPPL